MFSELSDFMMVNSESMAKSNDSSKVTALLIL